MNLRRIFLTSVLIVTFFSFLNAQVARQTGVIRGIIVDSEGNPLPGVTVTAMSPALMGTVSDVTRTDGSFRLPAIPAGTYTVTAEMQGFKKVKQEDIILRVGMVVTINLGMESSPIEEEVTVVAVAPIVDVQSTKIVQVISTEMLQRLPLARSLTRMLSIVPGVAGTIATYSGSIHGAAPTTVNFEVDGINSNCPTTGGAFGMPQFDAIAEIEIATGALPAQIGGTGGSFVNVVTKSGGNTFHGQVQAYYTREELAQILFPDEKLKAMGIGKPVFDIFNIDGSLSLGGPILKDRLWFFSDFARSHAERLSPFIPTTIMGKHYEQYKVPTSDWRGHLKLTTQFSKSLRFFTMISGTGRELLFEPWPRKTFETTFISKPLQLVGTGNLTWLLSSNTFLDLRVAVNNLDYPIMSREESAPNPSFWDRYTGYIWSNIQSWESYIIRHTSQASARITHFQDNLLGGNHEFGAGVEFQYGKDRYDFARLNPMNWFYWDGNPYYYRGLYKLVGPHPVFGDGLLSFTNCGAKEGDSYKDLLENRLTAYFQDSMTIKNRFTINAGIRIDYYDGWGGIGTSTGITGLPFEIGKTLQPTLGFNPFGPFKVDPIKDVLRFTAFSPRIGVSYDPFGMGRTALKVSYSRYSEAVPVMWFSGVSPAVMAQYEFNWWDLNRNGIPDSPPTDKYVPTGGLGVFALPNPDYLRSRVAKDLRPPHYHEYIASISHELFPKFVLKLQYLHKRGRNFYGWANYDKETGRYWYKYEQAPDYWVPFTTIVPAHGAYPEETITLYFLSRNSPWNRWFTVQQNIPENKRNYNGLEISFDKRYADGWALGGSVVFSRHMHNDIGGWNANQFINSYGRATWGEDLPFQLKLYGIADIPFGFIASFFFHVASGTPYNRAVTVAPPAAWAAANNAVTWTQWVRLEPAGARRHEETSTLDARLEKEFRLPFGKLGLFADVFNLMGNRYITVGQNPAGTWFPDGENTRAGRYVPAADYGRITGVSATRVIRLSLRFVF